MALFCNPCSFIIYGILLLCTLPIALVCAICYVIVWPFEACFRCGNLLQFFSAGLSLPATMADRMMT